MSYKKYLKKKFYIFKYFMNLYHDKLLDEINI